MSIQRHLTSFFVALGLPFAPVQGQTTNAPAGIDWNWRGIPLMDGPLTSNPPVDQRCLNMHPPSAACIAQWRTQQQVLNARLNPFGSGATSILAQQCATKADVVDALKQVHALREVGSNQGINVAPAELRNLMLKALAAGGKKPRENEPRPRPEPNPKEEEPRTRAELKKLACRNKANSEIDRIYCESL